MNLLRIFKKLWRMSSSERYIAYLRSKGMQIGEHTAILAPRHTCGTGLVIDIYCENERVYGI